jgi:hypothetical protein
VERLVANHARERSDHIDRRTGATERGEKLGERHQRSLLVEGAVLKRSAAGLARVIVVVAIGARERPIADDRVDVEEGLVRGRERT